MNTIKEITSQILLSILVVEEDKKIGRERKMKNLNKSEIFETELKEIYWTKRVMIRLLDQMIRMSSTENLADLLEEYQVIAHRQSRRLEDIFSLLSINPVAKICVPVKNIIHDDFYEVNETKGFQRDTEFVSTILKIQKYSTEKGATLCQLAETKREEKVKVLLEETQMEGELLDLNLEYLLERRIN